MASLCMAVSCRALRARHTLALSRRWCSSFFTVENRDEFKKRVLESKQPVVVDFSATWCGPCRLLEPRLKKAVGEHAGKVSLAKVDVDQLDDLAFEYNVSAVPMVVAFKGGKSVDKFTGNVDDDKLKAFVNKLLL